MPAFVLREINFLSPSLSLSLTISLALSLWLKVKSHKFKRQNSKIMCLLCAIYSQIQIQFMQLEASGKCVEYNQNRNNRHNCNRIVVNYCLCLRFVSVVVIAPDWIKLACVYVWARYVCVCVCVCAPKRARQIRCLAVEEVQAGV